jgi:hypothetical protein
MAEPEDQNQNDCRTPAQKVSQKSLFADYSTNTKRVAAIRRNHELLRLLSFNQPLSTTEIQKEYYIPKDRLQRELRQLLALKLIIKVNFERHVLYVIDGTFNSLIKHTLSL